MRIHPLLLFTALLPATVFGQQDMMLYNVSQIPQSFYANPAIIPDTRVNVALPGTNTLFQSGKSQFHTTDAFYRDDNNHLRLDGKGLVESFEDRNEFRFNTQVDILHVGFEVGLNYFQFNVTEHAGFIMDFPREATLLIREAYEQNYLGQNIAVNDLEFTGEHYREYGLGYARRIGKKLTVGARFKYLYGLASVSTYNNSFYVDTDLSYADGDNTIGGGLAYEARTAGLRNYKNPEKMFFGGLNEGFAADLGVNYDLNNFIDLSASVQNAVGFIHWRDNVVNYNQPGREIIIDPINLAEVFDDQQEVEGDLNQQLENMLDSLIGDVPGEDGDPYTTQLPTRVNLAVALTPINSLTFTFLNQNVFHPNLKDRHYLKVMMQAKLKRAFTAIVAYDIINSQVGSDNLGLGFALNAGFLQLYALAEDALFITNTNKRVNGSVRMGLNLTFGRDNL